LNFLEDEGALVNTLFRGNSPFGIVAAQKHLRLRLTEIK
jgi:hypothetical protein